MRITILPKTMLGRWSLGLIVAMPVLFFIGMSFTSLLYKSVPAGGTILKDITVRPAIIFWSFCWKHYAGQRMGTLDKSR